MCCLQDSCLHALAVFETGKGDYSQSCPQFEGWNCADSDGVSVVSISGSEIVDSFLHGWSWGFPENIQFLNMPLNVCSDLKRRGAGRGR